MKTYFNIFAVCFVACLFCGCGGAPETNEAANQEMQELEQSEDYQNQMTGGGN